MARILIAGCGDVGIKLGLDLVHEGHKVWGLRRNPAALPAALKPVAADLTDMASLMALPARLDYVFYTAATDGFSEQSYRAAYLTGVHNLMTALQRSDQRPRRVLFTSSTSVYGQKQGEWVDEASPANPEGFSGRYLRQGEELLWHGPYPATVVRFGGIYGPGRTRLLDTLRSGTATCVEDPPTYTNRIHRDDCAGVLKHVMGLENPERLYLGVDDDPAPQCQVLRWLTAQLGVAGPRVVAARQSARARSSNKRCRNTRLRASGFRFRYPGYRDGYGEMLTERGLVDSDEGSAQSPWEEKS